MCAPKTASMFIVILHLTTMAFLLFTNTTRHVTNEDNNRNFNIKIHFINGIIMDLYFSIQPLQLFNSCFSINKCVAQIAWENSLYFYIFYTPNYTDYQVSSER